MKQTSSELHFPSLASWSLSEVIQAGLLVDISPFPRTTKPPKTKLSSADKDQGQRMTLDTYNDQGMHRNQEMLCLGACVVLSSTHEETRKRLICSEAGCVQAQIVGW